MGCYAPLAKRATRDMHEPLIELLTVRLKVLPPSRATA
jgi:hypothetical protein